jgi:hypothetical protein
VTVINNITINRGRRSHNVTDIYGRWDRKAVHSHARDSIDRDHGARQRAQVRPGNGFVVGPDGRRKDLGDRSGRRDWKDAGADTRNRADLAPIQRRDWKDAGADTRNRADLPPIQRRDLKRPEVGGRRDLSMNQRRDSIRRDPDGRSTVELPRIQTPHRRSDANVAPINPGRESSQAAQPRSQAPLAGQSPRPRQDIQERQRRDPAMTRQAEPDRAQPQFRSQPRQLAEPSRLPDRARERAPREWRQERAAPSFPSAGVAPARPQVLREQGAQMPRVIPEARASGGALRERVERNIGAGAGRVESHPQSRGGESKGHRDRGAGPSGPRFGERQR